MKAIKQTGLLVALAWALAGNGQAQDFQVRVVPVEEALATSDLARWDSVGGKSAEPVGAAAVPAARKARVLPAGYQARKAEVVRRMFWIVLAHR